MSSLTTGEFRKALGQFPTGVTVLTVMRERPNPRATNNSDPGFHGQARVADPGVHGMTANSFASVSLDPLQILVCVDTRAKTHSLVKDQKLFGVNFLHEDHESWARFFAKPEQHPSELERLGITFRASERGTPLLEAAIVQLDCELVSSFDAGDHSIFLAQVHSIDSRDGSPLLFHSGSFKRLSV
jgi:flavin reductase (DIM6/NTAB) family NADH-FMN oxidoreductase RutF